jgi:hypothetical protein
MSQLSIQSTSRKSRSFSAALTFISLPQLLLLLRSQILPLEELMINLSSTLPPSLNLPSRRSFQYNCQVPEVSRTCLLPLLAPLWVFPSRCQSQTKFVRLHILSSSSTLTNAHLSGQEQVRDPSPCITLAIPISTCNSSLLQVPFLNLMATLVERVGWVQVRVGGNSQDSAELVSSLPNGTILAKDLTNTTGVTRTPPLEYTTDLLQMMADISKLTNVHWYLG